MEKWDGWLFFYVVILHMNDIRADRKDLFSHSIKLFTRDNFFFFLQNLRIEFQIFFPIWNICLFVYQHIHNINM